MALKNIIFCEKKRRTIFVGKTTFPFIIPLESGSGCWIRIHGPNWIRSHTTELINTWFAEDNILEHEKSCFDFYYYELKSSWQAYTFPLIARHWIFEFSAFLYTALDLGHTVFLVVVSRNHFAPPPPAELYGVPSPTLGACIIRNTMGVWGYMDN